MRASLENADLHAQRFAESPMRVPDFKRLTARIEGRVQGVGFRAFTSRQGQRLRLTGSVRNLADGSVELVAEGSEERLQELLTQVRRGPSGAVVTGVEASWAEASGDLKPFGIGY